MVRVSLRLSRRLPPKIISRTLTSATSRSSSSPSPLPRPTSLPTSSNTVPDLCLGAGGKAPGFVQQMLFSAPVQEKNAKGIRNDRHLSDFGV